MKIPDQAQKRLLDYRIQAIDIGLRALEYAKTWDSIPTMKIYFNDKLRIEGNGLAFTNPAVEAAAIHCRALLEFMGLCAASETKLGARRNRRNDDLVIEDFSNDDGPLSKVSIDAAVKPYKGQPDEAEHALAYSIHTANKGLAHNTNSFSKHDEANILLEIAFNGVKTLMINYFYRPLNLEQPVDIIKTRKRDPEKD